MKSAMRPLLLGVVSGGFVMAYGTAVASSPGEKLLCHLNTWDGYDFPEQLGCWCMDAECPVSVLICLLLHLPPLLRDQQQLRPK